MPITIKSIYEIGQIFYLVGDPEQKQRVLIKLIATPIGIMYGLDSDDYYDEYYACQISETKDLT